MTKSIEYNFAFGKAISLALYLGIGALLHALIVGATFDWSSAWTWGLLLGWPVLFTLGTLALGLAIMAAVFVGIAIEHALGKIRRARARKARAR